MANRYYRSQFLHSFITRPVLLAGTASLVQAVKATVVAQGITYTADSFGIAGNSITVTLTTGGTAGSEVVTVVGSAISVQIQSGVSTRTQVKTALDGNTAAAALVDVSVTSGGTAATAASAVTLAGGIDGVSSFSAIGIASVVRSGVGEYTITLQDNYKSLKMPKFSLLAATAVDLVPQLKSVDVVSAKTVVVRLLAGATATEVAAAATLYFELLLNNSSV